MAIDRGKRHAVVLRGRTGVGKTETRRQLERMLNDDTSSVVLDHGWGRGEKRANGTTPFERYSDLLGRPENLLLVELGWGEVASTRPKEWIDLLRSDGRHVLLFRLVGESRDRHQLQVAHHEGKLGGIDFATLAEVTEIEVMTAGKDASVIAAEVIGHA